MTNVAWNDPVLSEAGNVALILGFCSGEDKVLNDCRSGKLWVQHNATDTH
jgi:hypothetical protein